MRQINIKNQIITITLIIAVLGFIIGFLIIIPTIKSITQLQNEITNTQKYIETQYEKTQRMRKSVHNLDDIVEQVEKFKQITITHGSELEIITKLEQLANTYNINQALKATFYQSGKGSMSSNELPVLLKNSGYYVFSFNSEGTYENIIKYYKAIEELPYYFIVNSVHLSEKSDVALSIIRFDALLFTLDNYN